MTDSNPLLIDSPLPFQFPQFDKIRNEHFAPAIEQGMREQLAEVEAIAGNPEAATFENTVVALERCGRLLGRTLRVFMNLASAHTNAEIQALERDLAPKLAAHSDTISLNPALFARIDAVYQQRASLALDAESDYLLQKLHKEFTRAGANLDEAGKAKLRALNAEIATLRTTFEQNVLKEQNACGVRVTDRAELAGMSDAEIEACADGDAYVIRLKNTTSHPAFTYLENRALRERIQKASLARGSSGGEFDNRDVVLRLVRLRAERSRLLGYANHAEYQTEEQTARTVDAVDRMLADIAERSVRNARREAAELQEQMSADLPGESLETWDWLYYAEKVRQAKYAFDESELRPYLELNRVLVDGVFYAAERQFGITFRERHDLPVYLPDVQVYEVFDADGKPLAIFLADNYARPSKQGGAWNSAYIKQSRLLGTLPVVANHMNVQKPPEGEPTLLTWDEVVTLFHEFGHALHTMLSDVQYPKFSGTSVPRDFVEFPSQVNEMWTDWPEVLRNYARHHETGEPMPAALLEKLEAAAKFNQGYKTTEYVAAALVDQAWHKLTPEQVPDDAVAFEAQALEKAGVALPYVPPRYRSFYFTHVFSGGYSAGYYSYIWAEVLDADAVAWFEENGGLTRANGDRLRAHVLSRGGSADSMTLYRAFAGRDPNSRALLERRGLDA